MIEVILTPLEQKLLAFKENVYGNLHKFSSVIIVSGIHKMYSRVGPSGTIVEPTSEVKVALSV